MKRITVPRLENLYHDTPLHQVSAALDLLPLHQIAEAPWSETTENPKVNFAIAYNKDCIFLKYHVKEKSVRAIHRQTNAPVYKDSCVEFFIAFNGEKEYYNLEFNCLGTCLAGFGQNKQQRSLLSAHSIGRIKHLAQLNVSSSSSRQVAWQLTLAIPSAVFTAHGAIALKGKTARVNFYKCGDGLPVPHYLAWSNIRTEEPNFHLPEFFGEMQFV